jgi:hypothetical protein
VPGTATIVGSDGSTYANLSSGIGIKVAPSVPTATYTLNVFNAAGTAAAASPSVTVAVAPGTWSALNTNTFAALRGATVTALDNGKVLIAGGIDVTTGAPVKTVYLCDATGACVAKTGAAGMVLERAFHTAVKIGAAPSNAGKVLLAGGYTVPASPGPATPTPSAEFYDPATDTFASTTVLPVTARARHVAVLLDNRNVLIAGGSNGPDDLSSANDLSSAVLYDAGAAPPLATSVPTPMAQQRKNFTGTLLGNGNVLLVGGKTSDLTAELFIPASGGSFSSAGALPAGEDKRSHTAVMIAGASTNAGKVLISGGLTGSGAGVPSATQFLYSPGPGTFASIASLATARSNHAAISLPTDSVLICGGTSGGGNTLKSCERYDPATGTGSQLPTAPMIEARKDFGLARISISSLVEILAVGSPASPMTFAEAYNSN